MKRFIFLIILFCVITTELLASGDANKIDSILINTNDYVNTVFALRSQPVSHLENYLNKSKNNLAKCKVYNALCWKFFSSNPAKAMLYAKKQYPLAEKSKSKVALINAYDNMAWLYQGISENENAILFMLKSLKEKEDINDVEGISVSLSGLAGTYYSMKNYDLALDYFNQSYKIELEKKEDGHESERRKAVVLGNMGLCYVGLGDIDKGLETYFKAIDIHKNNNSESEAATTYGNMGVIYLEHKKDYNEALLYLTKSAQLHEEKNDVSALSEVYGSLSESYSYLNNFTKALMYGKKAVNNASLSNDISDLMSSHNSLGFVFYRNSNYKLAYDNFQIAYNLKDTIFNTISSKQIAEMQTKYNTEKKEAENNLLIAEKELDKAEIEKKSTQQKILMFGLLITIGVIAYVAYSLNEKKKTNKLLNAQNEEISLKKIIIEEKNKDITDSINYALRIQNAILPSDFALKKHYESFIYYRPKDIVSGDFYWIKEFNNKIYFSVIDCTGHGVPGALMSIIGANSLNKAVEDLKIEKTGEILDQLNLLVNKAMGENNVPDKDIMSIRDGMDISICSIDKTNNVLEYSGANNSIYILSEASNSAEGITHVMEEENIKFYEVKPDKMAIGGGTNERNYKTHQLKLNKNDTVYLFSDGYADQFGGPKGRKFMYKKFKRMFLTIQNKKMDDQLEHLNNIMTDWKGSTEQLDDICVMGVRV